MTLLSLLEESRSDSCVITIEATVVTGFEGVAMEEIARKLRGVKLTHGRGRVFFNISVDKMYIVDELRSVDNLYVIMKLVQNLKLSSDNFDDDIIILKQEVDSADVKKGLDIWCRRTEYKGIIYPSEDTYNVAKNAEVKIKKSALLLAQDRMKDSKNVVNFTCDKSEMVSVDGDSKAERCRLNIAKCEAYHELDTRRPEDKVLKYRVTCFRNGKHSFGSQDAAYHVGGKLQDMFHWVVDLNLYDVEFMLNIRDDEMYFGISLTKESKHNRNITFFGPTTLRATVCFNMLQLAKPSVGDIVMDPMCGGGSIPIECSLACPNSYYICGDIHEKAVTRTYDNLESLHLADRRNNLDVMYWDTTRLPLKDSSVDIFITDLPFGKRIGSVLDNRILYKRVLHEVARVVRCKGGRAVLLTYDKRSMAKALSSCHTLWKFARKVRVNIGGLDAGVYILWRLNSPAPLPPLTSKKKGPIK